MINDLKKDCETRMKKSAESLDQAFTRVRTGRAHPAILKDIMVPVHKVPENISVSTLFDMFIRMKMHLFIVQDEYGQTSGVV